MSEVVSLLSPRPDGVYVDCTVGLGGHAAALFNAGAGRIIAIDRDADAIASARQRLSSFGDRLAFVHDDYRNLSSILRDRRVTPVDGVLIDLGVSSPQLDDPARGFSFRHDGPLDMRMDRSKGPTLAEALATVDESTLADLIYQYGEDRHARRIARAIVQARHERPITRTTELATIVRRASGRGRWQRIDPATRTFQALRIWLNRELEGLDDCLETAVAALRTGCRLAVIAFHSLEDRIVKQTFRRLAQAGGAVTVVTRKPIGPAAAEIERNPRARSARLRAVEKRS